MIPLLQQDPNIDTRGLIEEIIRSMGLPVKLLLPEQEVQATAEAQAEAQQQMALGGAAVKSEGAPAEGPPPEGGIPPELVAALAQEAGVAPEQSLAAGGGAPIREA